MHPIGNGCQGVYELGVEDCDENGEDQDDTSDDIVPYNNIPLASCNKKVKEMGRTKPVSPNPKPPIHQSFIIQYAISQ